MTGYLVMGTVVLYDRWCTARTIRRLDEMLTAAMDGSFSEQIFDESRLTAQADKLQTLIEALVKTSWLETGILALYPQSGKIAPVVERAAAQYGPKAAEKGITLTTRQAEGSAVFGSKWTEEAVCNLLDNAVKYTFRCQSQVLKMISPTVCGFQ